MTNQIIDDMDKTEVADSRKGWQQKVTKKKSVINTKDIVRGMMWHEILSDPLCKRRRNK